MYQQKMLKNNEIKDIRLNPQTLTQVNANDSPCNPPLSVWVGAVHPPRCPSCEDRTAYQTYTCKVSMLKYSLFIKRRR